MQVLTATQEVDLEVKNLKDRRGNPGKVDDPVWESTEPDIISVTVDPANPLKATAKAVGPVDDESLVTFKGDVDLGAGVKPIIFSLAFSVQAGEVVTGDIVAGTPREQP
jgi:hypothetical protein